jgi:hypothetical protein
MCPEWVEGWSGRPSGELPRRSGRAIFKDFGVEANGRVFYIAFEAVAAIDLITIASNNRNDGYGIDNVSIGRVSVPEPGLLGLFGAGLLGMAAMRRRRKA